MADRAPQRPGGSAAADGEDIAPPSTPLLDQDEIDSLLGRDGDGGRAGLEVLLDHNFNVSYERLPMLEAVIDRLVCLMGTSLRSLSENVEVTLERSESIRFGDYLDTVPLPALLAVFRAVEWDNYGLITVDSPLIYALVDTLLGGRRGAMPEHIDGRSYTAIERSLVERLIHQVLHDMATAFAPLCGVQFRFERLEGNPRFVAIARPGSAAVLVTLRLELEERAGTLAILLPYATLEPVRALLLQMFSGEKFGRDSIWERHFAGEMLITEVELEALLDEQTLPLAAIMDLRVGTTLPLRARPDGPITLRCGEVPLMSGRIGRLFDSVAVLVDERIDRRREEA